MAVGEIKGSRAERDDFFKKYGTMLRVSDDGAHGLTVGTDFFTPHGGEVESGVTGRRLVSVSNDWNVIPGLCIHTAHYMGFPAHG